VGLAVKATPDELHAEIAVPAKAIEATGEYVKDMTQTMNNLMQQQAPPPAP
jgi:hypothetical protein